MRRPTWPSPTPATAAPCLTPLALHRQQSRMQRPSSLAERNRPAYSARFSPSPYVTATFQTRCIPPRGSTASAVAQFRNRLGCSLAAGMDRTPLTYAASAYRVARRQQISGAQRR
jgi:hypothetical protein